MELVREPYPDLIILGVQLAGISSLEHTDALNIEDDFKDFPIIAVVGIWLESIIEKFLDTEGKDVLGQTYTVI